MIKKFGVKNFSCFKEGAEVDFTFGGNVPLEISKGLECSSIIGIKGANGSGKTNLIKALSFLRNFCYFSSDTKTDATLDVDSYCRIKSPTEFYIDFIARGVSYSYELSVDSINVHSEKLLKIEKKKTIVIERIKDEITKTNDESKEIKSIQPRNNASILSMLDKYKFKTKMTDLDNARDFFYRILTNVGYFGFADIDFDVSNISEQYSENEKAFDFVKKIISYADSGINDISIHHRENEDGKKIFFPLFERKHNNETFMLTIFDESSGTAALYKKMYLYWIVLKTGGLLALDEFDIHLHAMILPKILDLFTDPETNTTGAQFLFTAHNTEIIDTLGKYRTILVNKENNESYCYRLDEIPGTMIRNDRNISPLYLKGKIGGVPEIEKI